MKQIFSAKDENDPNYRLYLLLKEFNGGNGLKGRLHSLFLKELAGQSSCDYFTHLHLIKDLIASINSGPKRDNLMQIVSNLHSELDFILLRFSVCLLSVKAILLENAQSVMPAEIVHSDHSHRLSLECDNRGKKAVYFGRVQSSLLATAFFKKLSEGDKSYIAALTGDLAEDLINDNAYLEGNGVDPLGMFMIMFTESVNQGIKSGAGVSYEDKIFSVIASLGIDPASIKKVHDSSDDSTEFDFLFEYKSRKYGIGAKRTLRERYKQFIKTARELDCQVMIEITLGTDLPENKAKTITSYGVNLFVSDEIYEHYPYLHTIEMVYPVSKFTLETLEKLRSFDNQDS